MMVLCIELHWRGVRRGGGGKNEQEVGIVTMPTSCFVWRSRLESNQWPVP